MDLARRGTGGQHGTSVIAAPTFTPEWYQPRSALQAACIGCLGCKHVRMADPDVRWVQRLENYSKALATLQRALEIASQRALSELEEQA